MAYPGGVRTLIVAPAWVGDMVMAHSLIQLLARTNNNIELHVAAPAATAPIATRMVEVAQVHTMDFKRGALEWGKRFRLGRVFSRLEFDNAFILPNSWKSALVPFFAGIRRRTAWHGEARFGLVNDRRKLDRDRYPLMIERFMALADEAGELPPKPYPLPRLQADEENRARCLEALALTPDQVTALAPGAEYGPAKKWPAAHYAQLATALLDAGREVWLLGSPKDVDDCAAIAALEPRVQSLAGHTSLLDAVDLLSGVDQVVCNDSGLMHIACALGRPTVGIFGSTSPQFTPPLGEAAVVVEQTLDCRPCFARRCPLGHLNCLNTLGPEQVLRQIA